MRSDVYDMAILCKEAADLFLEQAKEEFVIVGPVMENTDVFVIRNEPVERVAMIQNKFYQEALITREFGDHIDYVPLMANALPFALTSDQVDAGIMDYTKAFHLNLEMRPTAQKGDYTSFVLIARTSFQKTNLYREFVREYNRSVRTLNTDSEALLKQLNDYADIVTTEEEFQDWKIKIKELTP